MNVISSQTRTWMDAGIYVHDDADASTHGDADAALDVRSGAVLIMLSNMLAFGNMPNTV